MTWFNCTFAPARVRSVTPAFAMFSQSDFSGPIMRSLEYIHSDVFLSVRFFLHLFDCVYIMSILDMSNISSCFCFIPQSFKKGGACPAGIDLVLWSCSSSPRKPLLEAFGQVVYSAARTIQVAFWGKTRMETKMGTFCFDKGVSSRLI